MRYAAKVDSTQAAIVSAMSMTKTSRRQIVRRVTRPLSGNTPRVEPRFEARRSGS